MRRVVALIALLLPVLAGMASASSTYSCTVALSASNFSTFIGLAAIGIAISFLFIAVSYMAGEVLNYNALKGWYRTELWEVSKSILIIAVVFSSIIIASAIADMLVGNAASLQGGSTSSMLSSLSTNLEGLCSGATSYLAYGLNQAYVDFATMLGVSQGIAALKSISLATWFPLPIIIPPIPEPILTLQSGSIANIYVSSYIETITPTTVFSFVKDMFTMIIFPMLYLFQFQYDFISVIIALGLGGLLPVGIILRAMPFTRGIGGTFIALGIGASLVYPVLLVGFNLPISNYLSNILPNQPAATTQPATSGLFGQMVYNAQSAFDGLGEGPLIIAFLFGSPVVQGYPNIVNDMNNGFALGSSAGFYDPLSSNIVEILNVVLNQTSYLLLQLFLFIFDMVIGLAVVNQIATMLGGTMSISRMGVGKMKLS
ncbi:MAG: hypothetical protein M1360_00875 [Candidatus Marsarchaeota archaeon]|jgi:hypothetical protein|nr:hypothetical protein [Candidatus Marsarchaeota archaeon]MCL5418479.1 hypothetical protein [Candidatus Marsarchaeota archaeon]